MVKAFSFTHIYFTIDFDKIKYYLLQEVKIKKMITLTYSFSIASLRALPGLKLTERLASISMVSPVMGPSLQDVRVHQSSRSQRSEPSRPFRALR